MSSFQSVAMSTLVCSIVFCVLSSTAVLSAAATNSRTLVETIPTFGSPLEKQYTGYVTVDPTHNGNLFYWYLESRNRPDSDPLVLWLTGGPGCSSELAELFENGPYRMDEETGSKVVNNKYGWNERANLLFVDQPVNTGFSYATLHYVRTETEVAQDMLLFLQEFVRLYPELQGRRLFITGESFAGHYVPAISALVSDSISSGYLNLTLAGSAIGNGWINPYLQYASYGPFALANKLIDQTTLDEMNKLVSSCQKDIDNRSWSSANLVCSKIMDTVLREAGDINIYDIRLPCTGSLCYDFSNQTSYMNSNDVLNALHVSSHKRSWSTCNNVVNVMFKASDRLESFSFDVAKLLARNIPVLVYNGKEDLICNWIGGASVLENLDWVHRDDFNSVKMNDWIVNGAIAGQIKSAFGLTFIAVEKAGHMVPHDQPLVSLNMLNSFMDGSLISKVKGFESSRGARRISLRTIPARRITRS